MKKKTFDLSNIMQSKITWAVVAELLILLVCFIIRPDFFSIKYQPATGMLYGSLIDILNRSAEITIISMGMTLVIALAGTDLSVGSLVALSGALALKFLRWDVLVYNTPGDYTVKPFILVILVPLAVCTLMGLFNGFMISRIGMQPIIATLILMVCGRGLAQIVTNGKQFTTLYSPFRVIGQGSFLFLPMPIIITIVVVAAVSIFVRKTAFGTMVESVGINPSASRLSGINSKRIIMICFALTAFLSGIAGLIMASRVMSNDSNNFGINFEMDAILAVAIGGNSLGGGKFKMLGSVLGAYAIQALTITLYAMKVPSTDVKAYKAIVIILLVVMGSPVVKAKADQLWKKYRASRHAANGRRRQSA
jgi:Ribose/xylose/arabinose/galactoside ABC-type transport systems, permease components